jgi:hypothetical protein
MMPSYSFLLITSAVNALLVIIGSFLPPSVRGLLGSAGSLALFVAWAIYFWLGLVIDQSPGWAYRALLLGPFYLVWRLWISVQVRLRGDHIAWIRTRRREEINRAT